MKDSWGIEAREVFETKDEAYEFVLNSEKIFFEMFPEGEISSSRVQKEKRNYSSGVGIMSHSITEDTGKFFGSIGFRLKEVELKDVLSFCSMHGYDYWDCF